MKDKESRSSEYKREYKRVKKIRKEYVKKTEDKIKLTIIYNSLEFYEFNLLWLLAGKKQFLSGC